jgi:hypothetical protein
MKRRGQKSAIMKLPVDASDLRFGSEFLDGLVYVKRAYQVEQNILNDVMEQCKTAGHPGNLGYKCERCDACNRLLDYAEEAYKGDVANWYRSHGQRWRRRA